MSGIALPDGLQESEQLPEPIYTPSTKAEEGHDEAIDFDETVELVGSEELAAQLRDVSIAVYKAVAAHARERGVILADTKFEFGLDADGVLTLGDEVCTPDSSRFWPADSYEVGRGQPSFDKQFVRDWATDSGWDKNPPAPAIPEDVVRADARALRDRLRAAGGRAVRRVAGSRRMTRVPRADPAQGRDPRSAGPGRGARAAGARASRACRTSTSAGWSSSTSRTPTQVPAMCEQLLAEPADRGLRDPVKFGVVRFPGSCDEVDALLAASPRRRGRAAVAR